MSSKITLGNIVEHVEPLLPLQRLQETLTALASGTSEISKSNPRKKASDRVGVGELPTV